MSYKTTTSNKIKVFAIPKADVKNIPGSEIGLITPYSNIALIAKKASGKTTILLNIAMKVIGPQTKVVVFSPTFYRDKTYKAFRSWMKKRNIAFEAYDAIYQNQESANGKSVRVNMVDQLLDDKEPDADTDTDESEPDEDEKETKKTKKLYPDKLIIYDDISDVLRDKSIETSLKRNRHSKITNIISTQSITDLTPNSLAQIEFAIVWKGLNDDKLKELYDKLKLAITFEDFQSIYDNATKDKYGFLFIDVKNDKYQKNFG